MVRQLVRRSHLLAPLSLPTHAGLSRVEMLNLAFDHLDLDGSGELSYSEIIGFCRGLNPIKVHAEVRAMMRQMDKDGDGSISRAEYLEYMGQLVDILGDEEFERGVLETLATKPLISDLPDRETKLTALFRHLDADASGDLEIDELMPVFMSATPGADAAVDPIAARRDAKAQLAYLDEDGGGTVDLHELCVEDVDGGEGDEDEGGRRWRNRCRRIDSRTSATPRFSAARESSRSSPSSAPIARSRISSSAGAGFESRASLSCAERWRVTRHWSIWTSAIIQSRRVAWMR